MNICFITAGPIEWASSRMRAYWVAEALRERGHNANTLTYHSIKENVLPGGYDILVWQKLVDLETVRKMPHAYHYWDVCDPSWWWQPKECYEIAQRMAGVVASSQALADDFRSFLWSDGYHAGGKDYVYTIPDRLKLSHFHTQRQHGDVSPVRFIWFGVAANRVALWGARANLERLVANGHKIELTIFDDRPDVRFAFSDAFPIYHVQWSLDKEVEVLAAHDVALLPPYPGPWGEVKSNNKNLTAWACGLPSWDGFDLTFGTSLVMPPYPEFRSDVSNSHMAQLLAQYPIEQSAAEWEALLS